MLRAMSKCGSQDLRRPVISLQLHMSKGSDKGTAFRAVLSLGARILQVVRLYKVIHVLVLYYTE